MKKIVLSLLILTLAVAVHAQDGKHRGHKRGNNFGMLSEKLNLSEEQKAKMESYNDEFRSKMSDLKKNENITVKESKSQMAGLRKEHHQKIQNLLTADQKAQMDKLRSERKAKHEAMGKQRMEKMKTDLGLSDKQVAQLDQNRKEMSDKFKALRENKNMDDAAKKEQMKALHKEQKDKMKSILTEEQLQKLKERKKDGHKRMKKNATL